jgi:hypothetical protein
MPLCTLFPCLSKFLDEGWAKVKGMDDKVDGWVARRKGWARLIERWAAKAKGWMTK